MRRWHSLMYHISLFVLAQLAWFMLLGIWIYWYVSNYIIFQEVGDSLSPQLTAEGTGTTALVTGLILLTLIMILMTLIFKYLYRQIALHKRYGNFIANVTHELKSPLASVQLLLETIAAREVEPALRAEFVARMLADIRRLDDLVSTILEVGGLEQNRNQFRYTVNSADTVIHDIVDKARACFALPPGTISLQGRTGAAIVVDSAAMQTVFNNLVDNTIKYSLGPAEITISLKSDGKRCHIDYSDRGIGIPEKEHKKVFAKFYRGQGRNIPDVTGVGLGLYRIQEIMRAHAGTVAIIASAAERGTTFRLTLPVYKAWRTGRINRLLKKTRSDRSGGNDAPD